jgi:hypothetical protein
MRVATIARRSYSRNPGSRSRSSAASIRASIWPTVSRWTGALWGSLKLEHVALFAITTLGWPQAVKGLTWIRDVTR